MIGRNALIQIFSSGLSGLITFFTLSFVARLFGPDILGNIAYLFGLTGLIFAFSDLGFSRAHTHYTAQTKKTGQNLGTFLTLKSGLLLLSSSIAIVYFLLSHSQLPWLLFGLVILSEIFTRFSDSILITFEAIQQSLPQNLTRLAVKAIKLLTVIIIGNSLKTNLGYSLTFAIEASLLLFISLFLLSRFQPLSISRSLANKYVLYSLPFFAIIPLSYFQDNSLIVILKKFQPAAQVGYYSASLSLTGFIKTLYGSVMIYFFPKISSLFANKDSSGIEHYTGLAVKYLLVLFTPIFMLAYLLRQEIVNLVLGPQFLPAVPIFTLLLLGIFILMIFAPYGQVLFATRNHKPLIMVNSLSLVLAVAVSFLFVPRYGALATVWASLAAWFISGLWHLVLVKKHLNLKLLPSVFSLVFPAALIVFLTSQLINFLKPGLMLKLALAIAVVLIYFGLLISLKLVNKLEFKYLKSLIKS